MSTLTKQQCYKIGVFDSTGRWYPTVPEIKKYFSGIRSPSRTYPYSYWRAAQTKKFFNWLMTNYPHILQGL